MWLREDGTPYYVGKGYGERAFRRGSPPRNRITLLYWPDEATALAYEYYLIDFFGRKDLGTGCLRNFTDGGKGTPNLSGEARYKIGAGHRGKKFGPRTVEVKQKIREALRGRKLIRGHVRKVQASLLGRELSQEHRQHIGNALRGRKKNPFSEEHRRNIGRAQLGSKRNLGKPRSEETRKKISAGLRRFYGSRVA